MLEPKTCRDCFGFRAGSPEHKIEDECKVLNELECKNKSCSFYAPKNKVNFKAMEQACMEYKATHKTIKTPEQASEQLINKEIDELLADLV